MQRKIRDDAERRWLRRRMRTRKRVRGSERTMLVVYRSAKHIYAQLVDSRSGRTIVSVSSRSRGVLGDAKGAGNVDAAKKVGVAIAEAARARKIEKVVFNRNGFLYHGRVKALGDAAREGGLQF
jgi:large subunit ribosomal protein L18